MKNFLKNFFNDPTVISIIDTIILVFLLSAIFYGLHLLYKY